MTEDGANRETAVKVRCLRLQNLTLNEPIAKIAKALKRTDGATRQKGKRHRLVAQLAPRSALPQRTAEATQSRGAADFLVGAIRGFTPSCFLLRSAATPPIAQLAMSNDQRVSSGRLWHTFHVQSPSRPDKTRLYNVARVARRPDHLHP